MSCGSRSLPARLLGPFSAELPGSFSEKQIQNSRGCQLIGSYWSPSDRLKGRLSVAELPVASDATISLCLFSGRALTPLPEGS